MQATKSSPQQHVAVFVFPFGSHPRTLFILMQRLAQATPDVLYSFFNTAKSNDTLFSTSKPDLPDNVKVYSVEDGVPPTHVLSRNPLEAVELFLKATPENFKRGVDMVVKETGKKITCLLSDAFLTFAGEMVEDMHVFWVPVWICLSHSLSAHLYTDLIRQLYANTDCNSNAGIIGSVDKTLEDIPGLSVMRVSDLPGEVLQPDDREESLFSGTLSRIGRVLPLATAVVMNSCEELNPEALTNDLKSKFQNLLNVGFLTISLPPPPLPPSDSDKTGCLSWLDRQKPSSVVYISFGTVATLPRSELVALAEALEASDVPFLWSLRDNLRDLLPNGFLERTSMHGKIVAWAPQTHVLAHTSVGVFVTHCGSNSVFESVVGGVPMIGRPFFGDQRMTGRMAEDVWGIGVMVEGGVFTKSGLLKSLELILVSEQGKKMREKVQNLKGVVLNAAGPTGSATKDFKTLVEVINAI